MRLEKLLDFLKSNPNDTFILFALAKEYEKMGDDTHAGIYYQKLLEIDEKYVGAYYHLGKLQERTGDAPTAFTTYKKGMQIARQIGDDHAYSELAGAKLNLGDDEDFE
ncbi:MAG: tetratricopeptide repeat protein [Phaeodactylibacter sp.]|nr:tetratricopeptide repeat protein [Phaeodactylibacter sp.]